VTEPRSLPTEVVEALTELTGRTLDRIDPEGRPSISWAIVDTTADGPFPISSRGDAFGATAPRPDAIYRIASMTKSYTAAAVLSLRDEGRLRLDDTLADLVPDLPAVAHPDPDAAPITVRMLLSMGSGLATDDAWADRHLDITTPELDDALRRGVVFASRPDEAYEYSNLGYGLLGRVVRAITGNDVQQLVSERFLGPLGLTNTSWHEPIEGAMVGWVRRDGRLQADEHWLGDGDIAPMGGLSTTIVDLARWVRFLAGDPPGASALLRRSTRREMQRAHRAVGVKPLAGRAGASGYGFGVRVLDDPSLGTLVGHAGGLPGWGSNMRWHPASGFAAVALCNATYAPMSELTVRMLDVVHEHGALIAVTPPAPSVEIVDVADRLVRLLERWDDALADALFADNVAQDEALAVRRRHLDAVRPPGASLRIAIRSHDSDASARLVVTGEGDAELVLDIDLAPIAPARLQSLTIVSSPG
jgi:CubicO group peptidase (beta-lactamase class C family)